MQLAAICVVLVTCGLLIVMVLGAAVADYRRQRIRKVLEDRLAPYEDVTIIDLRDYKPVEVKERVKVG